MGEDGAGGSIARSYRDLLVWQKARALSVRLYKETGNFPKSETWGLTSQIRRAGVSVPSNIAEGQGRLTIGEFRHFLGQARGSLLELDTQLSIARDLGFLSKPTYDEIEQETYQVIGLLNRLLESLARKGVAALKP